MGRIFSLLMGYVLAAAFTDSVSMNIPETLWMNVLTYFIIFFWAIVWTIIFMFLVILIGALASTK